jgi:hypothetical protein
MADAEKMSRKNSNYTQQDCTSRLEGGKKPGAMVGGIDRGGVASPPHPDQNGHVEIA